MDKVVPICSGCAVRDARIAVLEAKVFQLEGQVRDLLDQLKPPAQPRSPQPQPPAPAKKPTGRKPGGQPGHPPRLKQRLPPERVNVIHLVPTTCAKCQAPLPAEPGPTDPEPVWHQVAELPRLAAQVTEYQGHTRTCPGCGEQTQQPIPAALRVQSFGTRLTSTLAYLVGCHGLSKRAVEEVAEAIFEVPIALGTVANLEREVSAALVPAYQEAQRALATAPVKHVDETGWKQAGKKRWLWVGATTTLVVFLLQAKRSLEALKRLVGEGRAGILCSDRWKVYDHWTTERRQVCWAHLKRNWEKKVERGGDGALLGAACLAVQQRVFELWHLFRGGGCSRHDLGDHMGPLMLELHYILSEGRDSRDAVVARFCARLLSIYQALWTFVFADGVEPTNNHAERVLRRAVLWRRRSFGCQSADGCRFVERILTAVQTLRVQKRAVLPFLVETLEAYRAKRPTPSLLPIG